MESSAIRAKSCRIRSRASSIRLAGGEWLGEVEPPEGRSRKVSPHSEAELTEAMRAVTCIRTGDVLNYFSVVSPNRNLCLSYYTGVVDFSPRDQVVTVRSGTKLDALQKELAKHGQCIPHKFPLGFNVGDAEICNLLDFNLPHALEGECGTWRDWVLGMRVVLSDGEVRKTGSHVVKNVTGYDVHK